MLFLARGFALKCIPYLHCHVEFIGIDLLTGMKTARVPHRLAAATGRPITPSLLGNRSLPPQERGGS